MVQVEGKAINPNFTTSKQGFVYTTFKVTDSQNSALSVSIYGTLSVKQGDKVRIMGTFHKVKPEIGASAVEVRKK